MFIEEYCTRQVITVSKAASVEEAGRLMRSHHVGDLIVTEDERVVGILTDRDIVVKVIVHNIEPNRLTVGDIMNKDVLILPYKCNILTCLRKMREKGVRRVPLVNDANRLIGIISTDDIVRCLSEQLQELSELIKQEQYRERQLLEKGLQILLPDKIAT